MWRHHKSPRYMIGDFRTVVFPHQMYEHVQPRGRARGCEDLAFIDIKRIGFDSNIGELLGGSS